MNNNPIGVFDSGIGGLTVVKEIIKRLPNERIIYLGDTARVPYGTRGKEVIKKFALELVNFLLKKKVKVLVVACNTISSICLNEIKKISPTPVLGVIEGAALEAAKITKSNTIGVIGTQATISSQSYEKAIKKVKPQVTIITQACPLFVPLVEEGFAENIATRLIAKQYLKKFKDKKVDTLILGCTHYPLLKKVIQKIVGEKVKLIDSAKPTAILLQELLEKNNLRSKTKKGKDEIFVTDDLQRVYNVASSFLGIALNGINGKMERISL